MSASFTVPTMRRAGQTLPGSSATCGPRWLRFWTVGRRPVWPSQWSATASRRGSTGHGVADVAVEGPRSRQDTVFRIGSITKTFTAIAVMQLWEQGLVDLDAPANDYLRSFRLVPADAEVPAGHRAAPADPHRRNRLLAAVLGPAPAGGRLRRPGRTIGAVPRRVLPPGPAGGGRAGNQVGVQQPRVRRPRPDRRGRHRAAARSLPARPRVRALGHGPHRPRSDPSGCAHSWPPGTCCAPAGSDRSPTATCPPRAAGALYSTAADMARYVAALLRRGASGTARCSNPPRWRPCSSRTSSPIPGCRAWGWASSSARRAVTAPSARRHRVRLPVRDGLGSR